MQECPRAGPIPSFGLGACGLIIRKFGAVEVRVRVWQMQLLCWGCDVPLMYLPWKRWKMQSKTSVDARDSGMQCQICGGAPKLRISAAKLYLLDSHVVICFYCFYLMLELLSIHDWRCSKSTPNWSFIILTGQYAKIGSSWTGMYSFDHLLEGVAAFITLPLT